MIIHFVSYLVTYFLPISSQFYGSICYWINCVKLELAPTNCFCFNCRSIELEPKLLDAYWHRHLLYLLQDNKKVLSIERQAVSVLCCCAHNPSSFVGQHRMSPKPPDQLYLIIICPSVLYASFATYICIFSVEQILSIEFFLAYRISFAIGAKTIRNQFCCILLLLLYCLYPCVL